MALFGKLNTSNAVVPAVAVSSRATRDMYCDGKRIGAIENDAAVTKNIVRFRGKRYEVSTVTPARVVVVGPLAENAYKKK